MTETVQSIYLLKDLARLSGHSVHTLKFYLRQGLIREIGRSPSTRFRYFDDSTLDRLSAIRAWRRQGRSLAEIERVLPNGAVPAGGAETRSGPT